MRRRMNRYDREGHCASFSDGNKSGNKEIRMEKSPVGTIGSKLTRGNVQLRIDIG